MTPPPARPKIDHITHVNNLPSILKTGGLWSDAVMLERGGPTASTGMGASSNGGSARPHKPPVELLPDWYY